MSISKECIGLAAEFAVASELCRRGIYAQLTFGNKKRTDILMMNEHETFTKIEVKAKRGATWPNCKGIYGNYVFLVLVDFAKRNEDERPDFYILNSEDWLGLVRSEIKNVKSKKPKANIEINSENVPIWKDHVNKYGKPYMGMGISPKSIQEYKESWHRISDQMPAS